MFGYKKTDYDLQVYETELKDFLPDNIVDAHAHIWRVEDDEFDRTKFPQKWTNRVAGECPIEDLLQTYKDFFPGKKVIPVVFGNSVKRCAQHNAYVKSVKEKYNFPTMYWTTYDMTPEFLEEEVIKGGYSGLKPYLGGCKAGVKPSDANIFDFLPHKHLEVANKLGLNVILHVSKDDRFKNKDNVSELLEIEQKYPNVKLTVAHIGRAYATEDLGTALDELKNTENMTFDFSANTNSEVIRKCIEAVGVKRVLFGTDLPIAKMRMKRIVENGVYINVIPRGIYGDVSNDIHMREVDDDSEISNFTYEIVRGFKKASEELSLSRNDVEDIMCNNACNLYGIKF